MSKPAILLDLKWENLKSDTEFRSILQGFSILNMGDEKQAAADRTPIKYAIVWGPEPGLLASCPNLEVIFSVGAGVDHIFRDTQLPDLPIVRFVDPALTGPMVEWVVLQVLLHMRQQRQYDALQRAHQWRELPQPSASKFRIGMMGIGELGQACAAVLRALGFSINSWSQSAKQIDGITSYHGANQLKSFLQNTDILISLMPLTDQTKGLLNGELIDDLSTDGPFGAPILINAGRGGSQVESDIIAALVDGRLRGASLDVFQTEPLPADSPLWDFDNLVITPHAAAISDPLALAEHVARQVKRHESGEGLQYLVDRKRGY